MTKEDNETTCKTIKKGDNCHVHGIRRMNGIEMKKQLNNHEQETGDEQIVMETKVVMESISGGSKNNEAHAEDLKGLSTTLKERRATLLAYLSKLDSSSEKTPTSNKNKDLEQILQGIGNCGLDIAKQPSPDKEEEEGLNLLEYTQLPEQLLSKPTYMKEEAQDSLDFLDIDHDDDDSMLNPESTSDNGSNSNVKFVNCPSTSSDNVETSDLKLKNMKSSPSYPLAFSSTTEEEDEVNQTNQDSAVQESLNKLLSHVYSHLLQPSSFQSWNMETDPGYEVFHFRPDEIHFLEAQFQTLRKKIPRKETPSSNFSPDDSHKSNEAVAPSKQLQQFQLPIIYHSHQTGFEPTKDLSLQHGDVIASQYYVEAALGTAAFSTAYQCIDLYKSAHDPHHKVCLKVIKNTKDFFDQSLDEIKILQTLSNHSHKHILLMLSYFYYREHLFIVTELLNKNLFDFSRYIDDSTYFQSLTRLKYIARQILQALQLLHSIHIIHSDIKPENILLHSVEDATVKIIDFGSSCYISDRQSSYIQSRSYRAPEVILGCSYNSKIDIWSLGCVIAEIYTNQVTFTNNSIETMLARIQAICGSFPSYMINDSVHGTKYFLQSGLAYKKVLNSDNQEQSWFYEVYKPTPTTLAHALGFPTNLSKHLLNYSYYQQKASTSNSFTLLEDQILFIDFIQHLLSIDPKQRPTASQALTHPWIISAQHLTTNDVKYDLSSSDGSSTKSHYFPDDSSSSCNSSTFNENINPR